MGHINTEFDLAYARILRLALDARPTKDKRTGKLTRGVHAVHLTEQGLPVLTLRDIKPLWFFAEVVWFLSGGSDPRFMEQFGFKNWSKFADDDGRVDAAYGSRWRTGFDQVAQVARMLERDRTSKRTLLCSWVPERDLHGVGDKRRKPNAPCVPMVHFTVLDARLHATAMQRSADLYYGLPHDIAGIAVIQHLLARRLGLEVGWLSWTISNAHLYGDQLDLAREMVKRSEATGGATPNMRLQVKSAWWTRAFNGDASLVWEMWHQLEPAYKRANMGAFKQPKITV